MAASLPTGDIDDGSVRLVDPADYDAWQLPELAEATDAWKAAQSAKRTAKDKAQNSIASKAGMAPHLWPLSRQCYTAKADGFEYSVCPFGDAKQDGTLLGKWKGVEPAAEGKGLVFAFENGAKCWNGPKRSLTVSVTCGAEDALVAVAEPETCTYTAESTSPAACGP